MRVEPAPYRRIVKHMHMVGRGTTFYSWLGVSSTASTNEISKAYRKKSVQLQCVLLSCGPSPYL